MRILRTLLAPALKALVLVPLSFLLLPLSSYAACTSPSGSAGNVVYNATHNVMQYCNGTNWVNTGTAVPGAAGTACTSPAAPEGAVIYNSPTGLVQFCNGDNWVDTACATTRTPGGSGCTSPTGAPGAMQYESANNEMQFCDSTNWVAMGWPCAGAATGLVNWAFTEKILPAAGQFYGWNIRLDGDTMVVGSPREDVPASDTGYVYVYTRSGGVWSQQAKFQTSGAATNQYIGERLALNSNTLAVGVYNEANGGGSGYVYVYTRSGSSWTQQAKLRPSDYVSTGIFGYAVAVDSNTLVIGDTYHDSGNGPVYVFTRSGSTWTQQAILTASDGALNTSLGDEKDYLAIKGDTIIVGAKNRNAAYVFTRSGSVWTQRAKLVPADGVSGSFGGAVSYNGSSLAIGARTADGKGAVYIFTGSAATWTQQAKIVASDGAASDTFGTSVSLDGDNLVVGAPGADQAGSNAGAAYFFKRSGTTWTQQAKVVSSTPYANGNFGSASALGGNSAFIGAYNENSAAGGIHVFQY